MQVRHTFRKAERLCSKKLIGSLFQKNRWFFQYPFRIIFIEVENDHPHFNKEFPAQVLFTVSKRKFKRAVNRNHLKRLMREAYRKNKHLLYEALTEQQKYLALGIIYTGKEVLSYQEIELKIKAAILRLKHDIENKGHKS